VIQIPSPVTFKLAVLSDSSRSVVEAQYPLWAKLRMVTTILRYAYLLRNIRNSQDTHACGSTVTDAARFHAKLGS